VTVRVKELSHVPPVTFGRGKDAAVQLDDPKCSRIHAAIRYWDDIFIVRDVNSHNGTFLNGVKIDVARVQPGDVIKVGDTELQVLRQPSKTDVTITV
jgi:pSer/pThr/pTyr-binding forkhead associated (FHA) protein